MSATFSVNGNTYEIKRTNYLVEEFTRIKNENKDLNIEDNQKLHMLTEKTARLEKLSKRVVELEDKFYETFDPKDEELYKKANEYFEKEYAEAVRFELELNGLTEKATQVGRNNATKLVIKALQVNHKGDTVRTEQEAKDIWNSYVEEVGLENSNEWLSCFLNFVTGRDEIDENPFVTQAKAKAEQKANMRKGILKAR